jgi:two-component system phosphate regulon sensor histidine kinase PhoR
MRGIQSKITLTFILISIGVVALLGVLSSYEIEHYYYSRILSSQEAETQEIAAVIGEASSREESHAFTVRTLAAIASAVQMRITLVDSSGIVVYDSSVRDSLLGTLENHGQRPEIAEARLNGIGSNIRTSASVHYDQIYVARDLSYAGLVSRAFPHLRFIRVSVDLSDVERVVNEFRFKIGLAALFVLVVIVIASRFVARRMSTPLVEIAGMVQEIKRGNFDQKLPIRSRDEIGNLAELINEMTHQLKKDIEQLKKLEHVRTEFLANVSHELRTPLFSLMGFLETLQEGAVDDPSVNRKFIEKAYEHATRLDNLLNDLIEISRIESGDMKLSFRYFDLAALLRQMVGEWSDAAAKQGQKLTLEAADHEISVLGDKERLRVAIGNIIDNALKYSQPEASVSIRLSETDGCVTISIADDGPGIEPEHLPRIFERFYRVDKARSREVGGTGLGLAIVKHIIEAHNSTVEVSSQVGKGTTFSFDLKK